MIDHVSLSVSDIKKSEHFYVHALAPLGYTILVELYDGTVFGFGVGTKPDFWIGFIPPSSAETHVAFVAPDRAAVDAFYKAGLEAGGRDNGAPGPRPEYHDNYYGAFLFDPDGNNIEAVCHKPPA